jgi:hypothetical protein
LCITAFEQVFARSLSWLPRPAIAQQFLDAAIAQANLLADDQAREQLRQREVVTAELGGVLGQAAAAEFVGGARHFPWRSRATSTGATR